MWTFDNLSEILQSLNLLQKFINYKTEDVVWLPMRQLYTRDQNDTEINNYRSQYCQYCFFLLMIKYDFVNLMVNKKIKILWKNYQYGICYKKQNRVAKWGMICLGPETLPNVCQSCLLNMSPTVPNCLLNFRG